MLACLFIAAALPVVQNIRELTESNISTRVFFDVTGRVLGCDGSRFAVEDETGRGFFTKETNCIDPVPGDRVRITGYTWTSGVHYHYLTPTNIVRLGTASPPVPLKTTLAAVVRGDCDYLPVTVQGIVTDIHSDELEDGVRFLVLRDGPDSVIIPLRDNPGLKSLLGAVVSVTGLCSPKSLGWRLFASRCITPAKEGLVILKPAPTNRLSVPPLGNPHRMTPQALSGLGYRHIIGVVRAIWQSNRIIVETGTEYGSAITALLADSASLPDVGTPVRVAGLPETDLISITLNNAVWRPEPNNLVRQEESATKAVDIRDLLGTTNRITRLQAPFHGRLIRLTGLVGPVSTADASARRFPLVTSDGSVVVDTSGLTGPLFLPETGSRIAVTGVAILEAEPWRTYAKFPSVKGFTIVLRTPADIEILARPPWWTPARLFAALCALFAALIGILVWNRVLNRLVERRSRELLRERSAHENADLKLEERTRLAVELHDSLSQNLEGVACQVSATRGVLTVAPEAVAGCLDTAERMLDSCRTELRRCLFDLRGNALEARVFAEALRRTLDPLALKTTIDIDFPVSTSSFDDAQVHAILCIVRELVTNAVRHGQAKHIHITGRKEDGTLVIVVTDDGCGFDPAHRPGPDEGHFGLQGVRDRLHRLDGRVAIDSKPGGPTVIKVSLPLPQ